jgi:hypothetical protein
MGYHIFAYFVGVVLKGDGTSFSTKSTSMKWCARCIVDDCETVGFQCICIGDRFPATKEGRKKKTENDHENLNN